jgi:nucleotide-binding universal stress UspA family protein
VQAAETKTPVSPDTRTNRRFMIPVDDSPGSRRAVRYAGTLLCCIGALEIYLLHVVAGPDEDMIPPEHDRRQWVAARMRNGKRIVEEAKHMLLQAGVAESAVHCRVRHTVKGSVGACILNEQKRVGADTIVIGRRGVSKTEEFLFGSTSNTIVHTAVECAVWVVM